jgi:mxaJ protein
MSSASRNRLAALALLAVLLPAGGAGARELRVCADPNNLPFSNRAGKGFENKIVELLARDLGATVTYTWWAQRRGFFGNTLKAGLCDVVPGVPSAMEMVLTTAPYYRSAYVFVTRTKDGPAVRSLDDPALRTARIGVQLIGSDRANTPPVHALARRGIVENVRGFMVYGDYREPNPPARIVQAVADGDIDVAIVWGPLAGYFAQKQSVPLAVAPVAPQIDGPMMLPMAFDISMGVRSEDKALKGELDGALQRRRAEIGAILARYGVPRLDAQIAQAAP